MHERNAATSDRPHRVLMVVANPSVSTMTGWPVGFWASELSHPWLAFTEAGYEVTIASPDGGPVTVDALSDPRDPSAYSLHDIVSRGFLETPHLVALLDDTPALGDLDLAGFDAIVVCGGQSPMFTFRDNVVLQRAVRTFHEAGKPTAALCHGVAALIDVQLTDGSWLLDGRTVTGFSNREEIAADTAAGVHVMAWRIEDEARARGANYVEGGVWTPFAVRDGHLITGQQQFSGGKTAALVIAALGT